MQKNFMKKIILLQVGGAHSGQLGELLAVGLDQVRGGAGQGGGTMEIGRASCRERV